jgi:hypothetical protein
MEFAFLALFGTIAGSLIGMASSQLFVPFFRYTGERGIPLPPIVPIIASDRIEALSAIFGLAIVSVEAITIASVLRGRLVQSLMRVWL